MKINILFLQTMKRTKSRKTMTGYLTPLKTPGLQKAIQFVPGC